MFTAAPTGTPSREPCIMTLHEVRLAARTNSTMNRFMVVKVLFSVCGDGSRLLCSPPPLYKLTKKGRNYHIKIFIIDLLRYASDD